MARLSRMAPLIVLVVSFVGLELLSLLGWLGAPGAAWPLRGALAIMFLVTASAHWGRRRPDLMRMVPSRLRNPGPWVTLTGVLEILGAIALLLPVRGLVAAAALGLALLLVALFPANVRAARQHQTIGGRPVLPVAPRALLQLVFLAATLTVFFRML